MQCGLAIGWCVALLGASVLVCLYTCGDRQSWDIYFTQVTSGAPLGAAYQAPPTLSPTPPAGTLAPLPGDTAKEISDHLLVNSLIRSYQVRQLGGGGGGGGGENVA